MFFGAALALRRLTQRREALLTLLAGESHPAFGSNPLDLDLLLPIGIAAGERSGSRLERLDVGCRGIRPAGAAAPTARVK
jgi:hypothetical protein